MSQPAGHRIFAKPHFETASKRSFLNTTSDVTCGLTRESLLQRLLQRTLSPSDAEDF